MVQIRIDDLSRDSFFTELRRHYIYLNMGQPYELVRLCGKTFSIFDLYLKVQKSGGFQEVETKNKWHQIGKELLSSSIDFDIDPIEAVNFAYTIRRAYYWHITPSFCFVQDSEGCKNLDSFKDDSFTKPPFQINPLKCNMSKETYAHLLKQITLWKFDRLTLSLSSCLKNEEDFVINVLLILSFSGKSMIPVCTTPGLIKELIMKSGIIFRADEANLDWEKAVIPAVSEPLDSHNKNLDFSRFWMRFLRNSILAPHVGIMNYETDLQKSDGIIPFTTLSEYFNKNSDSRSLQLESIPFTRELFRLHQILVILFNFSLDRNAATLMVKTAQHPLIWLLSLSTCISSVREIAKIAWETLASLCYGFTLPSIINPSSHIPLSLIIKNLQLPDLSIVTSVLECLSALASQPDNSQILYDVIVTHPDFLSVLCLRHLLSSNLMVKINAIEILFYLTATSNSTREFIGHQSKIIDLLFYLSLNCGMSSTPGIQCQQSSSSDADLIQDCSMNSAKNWLKNKFNFHESERCNEDDSCITLWSLFRMIAQDCMTFSSNTKGFIHLGIHIVNLLIPHGEIRQNLWNAMLELQYDDSHLLEFMMKNEGGQIKLPLSLKSERTKNVDDGVPCQNFQNDIHCIFVQNDLNLKSIVIDKSFNVPHSVGLDSKYQILYVNSWTKIQEWWNSESGNEISDNNTSKQVSKLNVSQTENADPLTASARLTCALILKNLAKQSESARSTIRSLLEEKIVLLLLNQNQKMPSQFINTSKTITNHQSTPEIDVLCETLFYLQCHESCPTL